MKVCNMQCNFEYCTHYCNNHCIDNQYYKNCKYQKQSNLLESKLEEIIEDLEESSRFMLYDHNDIEGYAAFQVAVEAIKDRFENYIQRQTGWISCNERLPNEYDNTVNDNICSIPVIVKYREELNLEPSLLHYNTITKKFVFDEVDETANVVAWRTLPRL